MFKELGQLAGLMRMMPKLREEMDRFQQRVGDITAEGTAGGDMVTVRVNGKSEIMSVRISEAAWATHDREMMEDLIASATNQALNKVRLAVAEETQKVAQAMGVPAGMGLPGLG